nr:hypothetical protein [Chloroflexota bacterium]
INVCAVCEKPVSGFVKMVPVYFCPHCFEEYKTIILTPVAWIADMLRVEKARRKRRNRLLYSVGLPIMVNTYQGVAL